MKILVLEITKCVSSFLLVFFPYWTNGDILTKCYTFRVFSGRRKYEEVNFDNGRLNSATFFSIKNIQSLIENYKKTGECSSGLYFYCADLVIVEKLSVERIEKVVSDLISNDELDSVFDLHSDETEAII